jgi:hypothetical protein
VRRTTGGLVATSGSSATATVGALASRLVVGRGGSTGSASEEAGRVGVSGPRRDADQADATANTMTATTAKTAHGANLVTRLLDRLGEGRVGDIGVTDGMIVVGTSPDDWGSIRRTTRGCRWDRGPRYRQARYITRSEYKIRSMG